MSEIQVQFAFVDAASIKILTNNVDIQTLLYTTFRYKDASYSTFNSSRWDGYNRLYSKTSGKFPIGLWFDAFTLIKEHYPNANIEVEKSVNLYREISFEEIQAFVDTLYITVREDDGSYLKITPYEHQIKSLHEYACHGRYTMLSATSSGKSMMAYLIMRYSRAVQDLDQALLVVPTKSLVTQLYSNFEEYSHMDDTFEADELVQTIYQSKEIIKPVMISTWQSLQKFEKGYFQDIDFLFIDECHSSDAKKLTKIANNCSNALNRIGATGTLKDSEVSEMLVKALFGYVIEIIGAKELIDKGHATPLKINLVTLNYSDDIKIDYHKFTKGFKNKYQKEIEFLIELHERRSWLCRFIDSLEGNTLVLFDRKDSHLVEDMKVLESFTDKDVHVISGDIKVKDRNYIKRCLEEKTDQVLGATYGTFQLGESVDNLHNLVLAHGTKSNVRILQSIGRMMRKHKSKDCSNIFDVVDVIDDESFNYLLEHSLPRLRYYIEEGHPVKTMSIHL